MGRLGGIIFVLASFSKGRGGRSFSPRTERAPHPDPLPSLSNFAPYR